MTYRILSLDGGGIRGVIAAIWLGELARRNPQLLQSIDLYAGTSMGAANAVAFAKKLPLEDIIDIYKKDGPVLFGQRLLPRFPLGWLVGLLMNLPGFGLLVNLFLPKWNNTGLSKVLTSTFGTTEKLTDLDYKVVLTTMRLREQVPNTTITVVAPKIMHNFSGSEFCKTTLHDALMRSMSAPVFFPSYQGYVDGGVFATNPSIAAIGTALDKNLGGKNIEDIRILSIGAGIFSDGISNDGRLMWGLLKWGEYFPDASTISVDEFDAEQAAALLGDQHYRLNAVLPGANVALDDYHAADTLIEFAKSQFDSDEFKRAEDFVKNNFLR